MKYERSVVGTSKTHNEALPSIGSGFFSSLITPIRRRVTARIYLQNEPVRQYSSSAQITGTVAGTIVGITKMRQL